MEKSSVRLRGWDFPHIDDTSKIHKEADWIGQELEWNEYREIWRFYQSGQIAYYGGLFTDWSKEAKKLGSEGLETANQRLSVLDIIFRYTEIFEFAARLSLTEAGGNGMHIEATLDNLGSRSLWLDPSGHWGSSVIGKFSSSMNKWPYEDNFNSAALLANTKELALKPAIELFRRFGWNPPLEILRDMQGQLARVH
ncbi:MAG: hypothetical protein ACRD4B_04000 [Acidobacteriota bacterium]